MYVITAYVYIHKYCLVIVFVGKLLNDSRCVAIIKSVSREILIVQQKLDLEARLEEKG